MNGRIRWPEGTDATALVREFGPFVERLGYRFNSDASFVSDVLSGVLTNLEREGDTFCPCRIRTGEMVKDLEIVCPCIPFHRDEFAALGKCWCGLFVLEGTADDSALMGSVPALVPGADVRVPVVRLDDLCPGTVRRVQVGRTRLAVARVEDEVFALSGVCRHAGGQLGEGYLDGDRLMCPSHGWRYDVRSGTTDHPDSDVRTFPVDVEDGMVFVTVPLT